LKPEQRNAVVYLLNHDDVMRLPFFPQDMAKALFFNSLLLLI